MATFRTSPGRISRINRNNGYPAQCGLVFDETPELEESPIVEHSLLAAADLYPAGNTLEVFKSDLGAGVESLGYDPFGNYMVDVGLESGLLATEFAEFPLGGSGAFALQVSAAVSEHPALVLDGFPGVIFPSAISGDIYNAQVNTENIGNRQRTFIGDFAGEIEEDFAVSDGQFAFFPFPGKQVALGIAAQERSSQPTGISVDFEAITRDRFYVAPNQGNSGMGIENDFTFALEARSLRGNLANQGLHYVGRQTEFCFDRMVGQIVEFKPAINLGFAGHAVDLGAGGNANCKKGHDLFLFIGNQL